MQHAMQNNYAKILILTDEIDFVLTWQKELIEHFEKLPLDTQVLLFGARYFTHYPRTDSECLEPLNFGLSGFYEAGEFNQSSMFAFGLHSSNAILSFEQSIMEPETSSTSTNIDDQFYNWWLKEYPQSTLVCYPNIVISSFTSKTPTIQNGTRLDSTT